jgi:hypothetical protein
MRKNRVARYGLRAAHPIANPEPLNLEPLNRDDIIGEPQN